MDDSWCVFESFQQRVIVCRFVLKTQIGILHSRFDFAGEVHPEQSGESEIVAPNALLVAKAGLVRRDHAATAFDEFPQLPALRF